MIAKITQRIRQAVRCIHKFKHKPDTFLGFIATISRFSKFNKDITLFAAIYCTTATALANEHTESFVQPKMNPDCE